MSGEGQRFGHIISLGSDCDASLQLGRIGWKHTHSVFDWLITPWDAMLSVLCDDGARLATGIETARDGISPICGAYGLIYWHEFPRDGNRAPIVTPSQVLHARGKLRHKMDRMGHACRSGGSVLFIRAGIVTDSPTDRLAQGAPLTGAELDAAAALLAACYPGLRFSLLVITYPGRDRLGPPAPTDPRITLCPLVPADRSASIVTTRASDADWDSVFAQVPYSPSGAGPAS